MERETEDQVIDLGVASVETKGGPGDVSDDILLRPVAGISAD